MSSATLNTELAAPRFGLRRIAISSVIFLFAAVAMTSEPISQLLQFDHEAIAAHQWWRLITGHLTHWDAGHFTWDAMMFAVLGVLCECRNRGRYVFCLVVSVLAISASVYWFLPKMSFYRGLSGVDSALFTLAVALLLRDARRESDGLMIAVLVTGLLGLVAKLAFEITTGATLFVDSSAAGFTPLPLVHAIGAAVGLVSAIRTER
jgi:rhomboid family GlyGly-CTERM serine protease